MKYIVLIKRAEINGEERDPSIGVLYLPNEVANPLITAKKAVDVSEEIGTED